MRRGILLLLSVVLSVATLSIPQTAEAQSTSSTQPKVTLSGDQLKLVSASVNVEGAAAAIDGDKGTSWEVSGGWPQEIVLELPENYRVTAIKYIHGNRTANYLTQYRIYASVDGQNWVNTSAPGTIKNTALEWEIRLSWPKDARYVRLVYLGSGGGNSALTAEIQVVSDKITPPPSSPPPMPTPQPAPPPAKETPTPIPCGVPSAPSSSEPLPPGNGATLYVSPNGSGSACTASAPCSLETGLATLRPGDTLILQGGTYNAIGLYPDNAFVIPPSAGGTSEETATTIRVADGATVTITGALDISADWVRITGENGTLIQDGQWTAIVGVGPGGKSNSGGSAKNVILKDFEIRNNKDHGWLGGADNLQFINMKVHHNGIMPDGTRTCIQTLDVGATDRCHGVYTGDKPTDRILIQGGEYYANEGHGLHLYNGTFVIRDVNIHDNYGAGIGNYSGATIEAYNNYIHDNGQGVLGGNNINFYNNTVVNNRDQGLFFGGSNGTYQNNLVYGNGMGIDPSDNGGTTTSSNNSSSAAGANGTVGSTAGGGASGGSTAGTGAPGVLSTGCKPASSTPPPASAKPPVTQPSASPTSLSTPAPAPAPTPQPTPSGQVCFTMGGEDIPVEEYDPAALFNKEVNGRQMTVTAYSNLAAGEVGEFAYQNTDDGISRGLGVRGGEHSREINAGEGLVIDFGGGKQTSLIVGLRDLYTEQDVADGVETASWAAYRDGVAVAQGKAEGTASYSDEGEWGGKLQFQIAVAEGFDKVIFYSEEEKSDYSVEYVDAKATPGFDCAGKPLSSSGSGSSSGSSGSSGSSSPPPTSRPSTPPPSDGEYGLPPINGNTYYVSPSGSDDVSCEEARSSGRPMSTINAASQCLEGGDILYVRAGFYDERPGDEGYNAIPGGTSWDNPVIIAAYPGETPEVSGFGLDGPYVILDGFLTHGIGLGDSHIRIQNTEVTGSGYSGIAGGSDDIQILNVHSHHNGLECGVNPNYPDGYCHGLYLDANNSLVEGGSFHDNNGYGIQVRRSAPDGSGGAISLSGNTIRNTHVYDNVNGGIIFVGCNNTAENNVVTGNSHGIAGAKCNDFSNDTFSGNANGDIIP